MDPRELVRQAQNNEVSLLGTFIELTRAIELLAQHGFNVIEAREDLFQLTQEVGTIMPIPRSEPDMDPQILSAIEEVVEYLYSDELKSFQEDMEVDTEFWSENGLLAAAAMENVDSKETHIFCAIARIKRWLP